jgi:glycosyltransferase involved in cell wall biosynthesis
VSTVYRRHGHHAGASGYPRFVDRLDQFADVRRPLLVRVPRRLLQRYCDQVVYEWFQPDQLRLDLTAASRLAAARREVVHLLYGETDHFYAGRLRPRGHRRGNRLVATFHQPPALLDELLPAPPLFEQLDHAIALGPRAEAHLAEVVGRERVSRAFLGVDADAWRPGRPAATPTCVVVGSWFRDFPLLADVIRIVHAAEPAVRFEVVTAPSRLASLPALPGVRARAGISDAELLDAYRRSWVSLVPLVDAVGNNALLEAMSCGLATVASDVGDVAWYAGDAARLVPPGDADAMAAAALGLLADPAERLRLGQLGRARAEQLDLTASARRHAEIYRNVSAQPV